MISVSVCLAAFAVAVIVCIVFARREQAAFDQRFPPISDVEFLARCPPGTDPRVALKVRHIIAEALDVECERVYPSSRLAEDLGAE